VSHFVLASNFCFHSLWKISSVTDRNFVISYMLIYGSAYGWNVVLIFCISAECFCIVEKKLVFSFDLFSSYVYACLTILVFAFSCNYVLSIIYMSS
jgi:hypothetical protein